ncbi:MAG: GHKL domain-containing protein [Lachnospira sp.]
MLNIIECFIIILSVKPIYFLVEYLLDRKKKLSKILLNGLVIVAATSVIDISLIVFFIKNNDLRDIAHLPVMTVTFLTWFIVQIIFVYIFMFIKRFRNSGKISWLSIIILLFPVFQLSLAIFLDYVWQYDSNNIIVMVCILLAVFSDALLLYVVYTMENVDIIKNDIEMKKKELLLLETMRAETTNDEQRLLKLKESYQKQLNDIYKEYSDNSKKEVCAEHIDELEKQIKLSKNSMCHNIIVNTILMEKEEICRNNNIKFTCNVNIGDNIGISNFHLCSIFNNLLNNAIEACERLKTEQRYIDIRSYIKNNYLNIVVINSASPNEKKETKKGHGYGLRILEDIAIHYNGRFRYELKNKEFKSTMSLMINDNYDKNDAPAS